MIMHTDTHNFCALNGFIHKMLTLDWNLRNDQLMWFTEGKVEQKK